MALIHCSECGKEISDSAEFCPNCGCKTDLGKKAQAKKGLVGNCFFILFFMVIGAILFFTALQAPIFSKIS